MTLGYIYIYISWYKEKKKIICEILLKIETQQVMWMNDATL
jgi:hypothetical protein